MIRLHRSILWASVLALLACSGNPEPDSAAEATPVAAAPATQPELSPPPPRPEPDPPETVVVLEDAKESRPPSLVEAALRERQRQERAERPKIVITDENLAEHATGQVTVAAPAREAEGQEAPAEDGEALGLGQDESFWRHGARERRLRLRRAVDEVLALEEQVAALRLRFYAEDDPYVRDSRIKPAWDRSLERLEQARQDVEVFRRDLQELMEQGRKAGALPGWLREAAELEPSAEEIREATRQDPGSRHWPEDPEGVDPNPNEEDEEP